MAVDEKWYFTKEQLLQSPSRKSGYDVDKELSCRQQAANFIQDMGQRLQVSQLCINTAIVYMHRFYVFHSLAAFHRNAIAAAALFLAAKVEEQPRKLEHVIKVAHLCLHRENPNLDTKSELYLEQAQDLVFNENVLLQTLGFDVAIDHPHTHVVRCCQLVRASKDLAQTSYFMASNSLHLTTMCLQYKPTIVACFCIHLACKWSNWEIPRSNEGKDWFWYIDKTVSVDLLEQLTAEFLAILDKCPTKLKRKMMSMNQNNTPGFTQQSIPNDSLHFDEPRKLTGSEANKPPEGLFPIQKSNSSSETKPGTSASATLSSTAQPGHGHHQKIDYREYREKKERERMEREKIQQQQQQHQRDGHNMSSSNHHHHSKSGAMPGKNHSNIQSRSSSGSISHKSYQQLPHGMQQNVHFQNMKENRDSNSQNFQSSSSTKDSSYLKQHPSHGERDGIKENASFHGQYPQNSSNIQQKPNYSGSYPHRERSRSNHGVQNSGNSTLPQSHHNQNQNLVSNSMNLINNSREALGSQRESAIPKESTDSQSQPKDTMSSSIRDIISQTVSQKEVHSMPNERKEHIRDKPRGNYIHGNSSTSNFKPESVKSTREQTGINFHESMERKSDDFSKLKEKSVKKEDESVIETVKMEPVKSERFDETDVVDETGGWSFGVTLPNARNEKNNLPVHTKNEPSAGKSEFSVDSNTDSFSLTKPQSLHAAKMMDSNYKSHHYHSSSKNSDISQIKTDKSGAMSSSDFNKKPSDKIHEKHKKPQELERVPSTTSLEGINSLNDVLKHHKLKEGSADKHKTLQPGQHNEQRIKEKLSPSKYQEIKPLQRQSNAGYVKPEPSHFAADVKSSTAVEGDRNEGSNQSSSVKSNVINVKFPNEIRSDLGAVIYPTNSKATPVSKPSQGFSLGESKLSLANSVSTVNLLGIEKMVDTSISPAKQTSRFGSNTTKPTAPNPVYNSTAFPVNTFASSALASVIDQNDKVLSEQKSSVAVTNQDAVDVDVLGYAGKKRSEKKKKKEKHKHKEKDKDKSERKKEKKKHKDKDKERLKEKDKHKDKEKHKDKHKEKEIDVVSSETPIKITIPKDKISGSLKIKISKDCLKKEDVVEPKTNTSGELKIKISKDVFSNIGTYKEEPKVDSRKRERSPKSPGDLPHSKLMKTSEKKSSASSLKPNGMEGSSRNSNSRRYSVSENDSCFDISSFYDCPFDFEANGQGIIKTPDYDFEALNASELPQESNTSPDIKEIEDCDKNSHNESKLSKDNDRVATGDLEAKSTLPKHAEFCYGDDSCGDITIDPIPKAISPLKSINASECRDEAALKNKTSAKSNESHFDIKRDEKLDDTKKNKMISLKNCDVLKNYKTILDSHSRRCESEILKHSVSPVSSEENTTESNNNDDNNNKSTDEVVTNYEKSDSKGTKNASDTDNPNYYNKYFRKDNSGSRIRSREDKWPAKDKIRFEDRRHYDSRRYKTDYNERDRRDDHRSYRNYREYNKDASQYFYERKDERRFDYPDYSAGQYFSSNKAEGSLSSLNYDVNANGTPAVYQNCAQTKTTSQFPQICESALPGSSSEINVQYQYGYFNNYMYPPSGGYRFYRNLPFVNVPLIQQQPIPPGTGDSIAIQLEPPPLPLEPPPDLPPPPETPPPPSK